MKGLKCKLKYNETDQDKMTYYDQQRQIISQIDPINKITPEGKENLKNFLNDYKYLCLMCREKYDFTIFLDVDENYHKTIDEIEDLLNERGVIYDYGFSQTENVYQFWIKTNDDEEIHLYVLFNAEQMIVNINE